MRNLLLTCACALAVGVAGCGKENPDAPGDGPADKPDASADSTTSGELQITPGKSVGAIQIDMTYAEVTAVLGQPDLAIANNYVGFARYDAKGLELVLSTPEASEILGSGLVIAIGVSAGNGVAGTPRPGQTREEIEAVLGTAKDKVEPISYYEPGASVEYDVEPISYYEPGASVEYDDQGKAVRTAVFLPYVINAQPPAMARSGKD